MSDTPETDEAQFGTGRVSIDFARRLERERDEAREETIRTREFMDYGFAKAQEELATVTAQRDRLADNLCSVFNLIHEDPQSAKDLAETTLQSLTPKEA
jgi:hypothetical protein